MQGKKSGVGGKQPDFDSRWWATQFQFCLWLLLINCWMEGQVTLTTKGVTWWIRHTQVAHWDNPARRASTTVTQWNRRGQASRESGSETGVHGEWWGPECLRLEARDDGEHHPRLKWGPTRLPSRAQARRGPTRPPFWPQSLVSFLVTKIPGMAPREASVTATPGQAVTFTVISLRCLPVTHDAGYWPYPEPRDTPPPPPPAPAFLMGSRIPSHPESASSWSPGPAKPMSKNQSLCLEPDSLILLR